MNRRYSSVIKRCNMCRYPVHYSSRTGLCRACYLINRDAQRKHANQHAEEAKQ